MGRFSQLLYMRSEEEAGDDGRRAEMSGVSFHGSNIRTPPPSRLDTSVLIVTSSLFAVLLLALCLHFLLRWALLLLSAADAHSDAATTASSSAPACPKHRPLLPPSTVFLTPATSAPLCLICLADFADGDRVRVLPPCQHQFHVTCIDTWLAKQPSCPTCRGDLLDAVPTASLSPDFPPSRKIILE